MIGEWVVELEDRARHLIHLAIAIYISIREDGASFGESR